jgi:mono/diheme cytochrome c family protein
MIQKSLFKLNLLIISCVVLAACGGASTPVSLIEVEDQPILVEPPDLYADLNNPYEGEIQAISQGETHYQANCSSCHGILGRGDGPASAGLEPKPKDLAQNQSKLSDAYLFWRISEGGLIEPFNSLMPGWKGLLREEQIWQVITYLRTLGSR